MNTNRQLELYRDAKKQWDKLGKTLLDMVRLEQGVEPELQRLAVKASQLEAQLAELDGTKFLDRLRAWLQIYRESLERRKEEKKRAFGSRLEEMLRQSGKTLAGQYPLLKVGLFSLELDFEEDVATLWYGPKQERLGLCHLGVEKIAEELGRYERRLGCGKSPLEFLECLDRVVNRLKNERSPVPIIQALAQTALEVQSSAFRNDPRSEHFRTYSRADFSFDLYRSRGERNRFRLRLDIATRAQTLSRSQFLWVPSNESGEGSVYSALDVERES